MITLPAQHSQFVDKDGRPTRGLYDLLRALIRQNNELTPADVTALTERVTALEAAADPWANVYGSNGITIYGSLESGLEIRGPGSVSGSGGVPYYVADDATLTVALYMQALFSIPIVVDGELRVDGILVEV